VINASNAQDNETCQGHTHTPPPLALTKGSLCFPGHQEETVRMYWRDNYSGMFLSSLTSTLWLTWSKV